jgi:hypothetical protein
MFCKKGPSKKAAGKEKDKGTLVQCVTDAAQQSIREAAVRHNDFELLGLISGESLISCEARYHDVCHRNYTGKVSSASEFDHPPVPQSDETKGTKDAYGNAIEYICTYIQQNIIDCGTVERMSMLYERYLNYMDDNYPQYYNPNY